MVFSDDGRADYTGCPDEEYEDEDEFEDDYDYVNGVAAAMQQHTQSSPYLRVLFY